MNRSPPTTTITNFIASQSQPLRRLHNISSPAICFVLQSLKSVHICPSFISILEFLEPPRLEPDAPLILQENPKIQFSTKRQMTSHNCYKRGASVTFWLTLTDEVITRITEAYTFIFLKCPKIIKHPFSFFIGFFKILIHLHFEFIMLWVKVLRIVLFFNLSCFSFFFQVKSAPNDFRTAPNSNATFTPL